MSNFWGSVYLQIDGGITDVNSPYLIDKKSGTFNFQVCSINGNDFGEIESAFNKALDTKGKTAGIIVKTVTGLGPSFMKNDVSWHRTAPNDKQYEQKMEGLDKEDTFGLVEVN